jgi:hypothetical protein
MKGLLKRVSVERAMGDHPSVPRAIAAATVVGAAAAGLTYRILRN